MGAIGEFLTTRTVAQEDAILTGRLIPASPLGRGDDERCLIGHGAAECHWGLYRMVGFRFDQLCSRLGGGRSRGITRIDYWAAGRGTARAGQMIRARILSNRARRTLQQSENAVELAVSR